MKKLLKHSSIFALALVLLICVLPMNTKAATITNASPLTMPNASYSGTFVEGNNGARYYKFTVTTPGTLKVSLMSEFMQRVLLMNASGEDLWSSDQDVNDSGTAYQEKVFYLEPGTYYLGFGALTGIFVVTDPYGNFEFHTAWKPISLTESGDNDTLYAANNISFNQKVKGAFSIPTNPDKYHDKDFYKIRLSKKGLYQLNVSSAQGYEVGIYNAVGEEQFHDRYGIDSAVGLAKTKKDINLPAGTYYVMIEPRDSGEYGTYSLRFGWSDFAPENPSYLRRESTGKTSVKLSWDTVRDAEGYTVYQKNGKNWKSVGSTKKDTYTVKKLKNGTGYAFRVKAYVTINGKKNYSKYSDTCYAATTPGTAKITSIKRLSTKKYKYSNARDYRAKVTWKKVPGATEYKLYYRRAGSTYKSTYGTYKGTSATVSLYWSKYSSGSKTYYYYVVPVKKYKDVYYTGSYSKGKSYKFH